MEQHDSHVRQARTGRTVFYAEVEPGRGIELRASYAIPPEKLAWSVLRLVETKRLEVTGGWRDDLERLEAALDIRRGSLTKST